MSEPTAMPSPPAPGAPAQKKWIRWVALGCGGFVVVVVAFVLLVTFVVKKATAGPEAVVQEFLAAAAGGDYATAHDHFSAPLKEAQPLVEFTQSAQRNAMFFAVRETTFNNRSVDTTGAKFSGTVTLEAGTEVPASFDLVRENGAWKLIAYNIGS
jgi:hypothetical protein